jgi:hypothetical protein
MMGQFNMIIRGLVEENQQLKEQITELQTPVKPKQPQE